MFPRPDDVCPARHTRHAKHAYSHEYCEDAVRYPPFRGCSGASPLRTVKCSSGDDLQQRRQSFRHWGDIMGPPMQMTKILFAAVIAGLGSASAIAADLPARMSTPAVTPANSWTGFYVGGNTGGLWTSGDGTWDPLPSAEDFNVNSINGTLKRVQRRWRLARRLQLAVRSGLGCRNRRRLDLDQGGRHVHSGLDTF